MKKSIIIISLFVFVVIIGISAFLFYNSSRHTEITQDNAQNNKYLSDTILSDLEAELTVVVETSGQINPERYNEIEKILNEVEGQGYSKEKIRYLRNILSNLSVGGFKHTQTNENEEKNLSATENATISKENAGNDVVIWHYNLTDWIASRDPPECPNPLVLQIPVNVNLVTSVLYPGQVRGGNYKSHGGFRLDNSGNDIEVRASLNGFLWRANRYIQNGEVQYQLDIINPCGIMYRLDHLRVLPPKWMDILSQLPEPSEDSLSTNIDPLPVTKGEVLATSIGMQDNVFMDLGVYDLRQKNNVTQDPYAICWFNMLPSQDKEKVLSLPGADYESGKESDYC